MSDAPPTTSSEPSTAELVLVPVLRQIGVPLVLLDLMLLAGIIAAFVWRPDLSTWWRIAIAVALVVIPAAATFPALRPARRMWKSAGPAPVWALRETMGATLMRFKWAILAAVVLIAVGVLTRTMPALGLVALGVQAVLANHLSRAMRWQRENQRHLYNEAHLAAHPQGARAYWMPG